MVKGAARVVQNRLGGRMRALREARGYTQEQLGARVGISQKYLSELERGMKSPSWEILVALAHKGFEIKLAALMFGIDDDAEPQIRSIDELLAGRPDAARGQILRAVELLLKSGEASK
jgi:transcriptional regulator with XRE-family HTH domain